MQRNAKPLSTMYVSKAGRIRNDRIRNERYFPCISTVEPGGSSVPWLNARSPTSFQNLIYILPLSLYVTAVESFIGGKKTRIPNHERHEFFWIASYVEEFQFVLLDKIFEYGMRSNPDSMAKGVLQL